MKTNDKSKIDQMSGEWSTALSLVHNIGNLVKIKDFPAGSKCVLCGNPATNAEHLVDKGRGGNCTEFNVIPVCGSHKKGNGRYYHNQVDKWQDTYREKYGQESVDTILQHVGGTHEDRLNPYRHAIKSVMVHKDELTQIINEYMDKMGEKIDVIYSTINK